MAEVRWTEEATIWLRDVFDHIASDNPGAAAKTVEGIYDRVQALIDHPRLGQRYELVQDREVRVLLYGHTVAACGEVHGLSMRSPALTRHGLDHVDALVQKSPEFSTLTFGRAGTVTTAFRVRKHLVVCCESGYSQKSEFFSTATIELHTPSDNKTTSDIIGVFHGALDIQRYLL